MTLICSELAEHWRKMADTLRTYGAPAQAEAIERCAAELEERDRAYALEELTLEQAASEAGKSYATIQRWVADGKLENAGRKNAPRVRRGDLLQHRERGEDTRSIVDALIDGL